jgi:hypothetical protein
MTWTWLDGLIQIVLAVLVLIIFWGSIYAFFYAIFLFIFSAWDAEKIQKAWNSIRYMILGIIFTIMLLFVFPVIFTRVWLSSADKFKAQSIFNTAIQIVEYVFTFGWQSLEIYRDWWAIWLPWATGWTPAPSWWNGLSPEPLPWTTNWNNNFEL